jgi:aminopeptidase
MTYVPPRELLDKYADLLVNYALGSCQGIKPGESVLVHIPECAKPLYVPLRNAILKAGGNPVMHMSPDDVETAGFFDIATDEQLDFFANHYYRGITDQFDHSIAIIAESDKHELEGVDPKKLMRRSRAMKPYREWREQKEAQGAFTWTLALYGTEAMAAEVGMSLEEYWEQIIKACFLDTENPTEVWKETNKQLELIRHKLNLLQVKKFHVEGEGVDLWVACGPNRAWLGGSGRNIPSFELFISPDWRGTEGSISFNQPLYYMGALIEGIHLEFKGGVVVASSATRNEKLLKEMIAVEDADKIGEFSLTDGRFSHITRLMGETLYDENMGGEQGNTHIALGNAYQDSYPGDQSAVTQEQWKEWGFNKSVVHTDIISTTRRKVTAHLEDGSEKVIYQDGRFTV